MKKYAIDCRELSKTEISLCQEMLFELGYKWRYGVDAELITDSYNIGFLYANDSGRITCDILNYLSILKENFKLVSKNNLIDIVMDKRNSEDTFFCCLTSGTVTGDHLMTYNQQLEQQKLDILKNIWMSTTQAGGGISLEEILKLSVEDLISMCCRNGIEIKTSCKSK